MKMSAINEEVVWHANDYHWNRHQLVAKRVDETPASTYKLQPKKAPTTPVLVRENSVSKLTKQGKASMLCQVEGCSKDLTCEKSYYQRYRVCERHLKMLSLVVDGSPSRFCQQCGRFQPIDEFDGDKRSCRQRLLQHNMRRRKRVPSEPEVKPSLKPTRKRTVKQTPVREIVAPGSPGASSQDQEAPLDASDKSSGFSNSNESDYPLKGRHCIEDRPGTTCSSGQSSLVDAAKEQGTLCEQLSSLRSATASDTNTTLPMHTEATRVPSLPPLDSPTSDGGHWNTAIAALMGPDIKPDLDLWTSEMKCTEENTEQLRHGGDHRGMGSSMMSLGGKPTLNALALQPTLCNNSDERMRARLPSLTEPAPMDSFYPSSLSDEILSAVDATLPGVRELQCTQADINRLLSAEALANLNSRDLAELDPMVTDSLLAAADVMDFAELPLSSGLPTGMGCRTLPGAIDLPRMRNPHDPYLMQHLEADACAGSASSAALLEARLLREEVAISQMLATSNKHQQELLLQQHQHQQHLHQQLHLQQHHHQHHQHHQQGAFPFSQQDQLMDGALRDMLVDSQTLSRPFGSNSPSPFANNLQNPAAPSSAAMYLDNCSASLYPAAPNSSLLRPHTAASSFDYAKMLASSGGAASQYGSDSSLHRLSVKLMNCAPEQLPMDMRQRLQGMLAANAYGLHGSIRPGCVQLTLDVLQPRAGDGSASALSPATVCAQLGPELLQGRDVVVQLDEQVVLLQGGTVAPVAPQGPPDIAMLEPMCVMVGADVEVHIAGRGLCAPGTQFFVRMQGCYKAVEVQEQRSGASGRGLDRVKLVVKAVHTCGILHIEYQRGKLLSGSREVLVVDDVSMQQELSMVASSLPREASHNLLVDVGSVLEWQAMRKEKSVVPLADLAADGVSKFVPGPSAAQEEIEPLEPEVEAAGWGSEVGEDDLQDSDWEYDYGPDEEDNGEVDVDLWEDDGEEEEEDEDEDMEQVEDSAGSTGGHVRRWRRAPVRQQSFMSNDTAYDEAQDEQPAGAAPAVAPQLPQQQPPHPVLSREYHAHVQQTALQCLSFACDRGLPGTADVLLRVVLASGLTFPQVISASAYEGLSLFHRCMRSGSLPMAVAAIKWVREHKATWSWGLEGPMRLTPLHLVAVLESGNELCELVLNSDIGACYLWMTAKSADAKTPADLSRLAGSEHPKCLAVRRLEQLLAAHSQCMARLGTRTSGAASVPPPPAPAQPQQPAFNDMRAAQLEAGVLAVRAPPDAPQQPAPVVNKAASIAFTPASSATACTATPSSSAPPPSSLSPRPASALPSSTPVSHNPQPLTNPPPACTDSAYDLPHSSLVTSSTASTSSTILSTTTISTTLTTPPSITSSSLPAASRNTAPPSKAAVSYASIPEPIKSKPRVTIINSAPVLTAEALLAAYSLCFFTFFMALSVDKPMLQVIVAMLCISGYVLHILRPAVSIAAWLGEVRARVLGAGLPCPRASHDPLLLSFHDSYLEGAFRQKMATACIKADCVAALLFTVLAACVALFAPWRGLAAISAAQLHSIWQVVDLWLLAVLAMPVVLAHARKQWYLAHRESLLLVLQLTAVTLVRTTGCGLVPAAVSSIPTNLAAASVVNLLLSLAFRLRIKLQLWATLWETTSGLLVSLALAQPDALHSMLTKGCLASVVVAYGYLHERYARAQFISTSS